MQNYNYKLSTRRSFLHQSALVLGTAIAAPMILPSSAKGANDRLNIAWVGLGGMGRGDLRNCSKGNNVVALCDCDPNMWEKVRKDYPEAKFYMDFRKMLHEMADKIDVVGVGTPDHTHFAITVMAMNMGKHVFVEKPLAHSIWEVRKLKELALKKDLVTQMGNQGHASEGARLIKEWYEAGLIGEVKEVLAWTNRPKVGYGFSGIVQTNYPEAQTPPQGMDWDLWLGPVSKNIGFHSDLHPKGWRSWWDFGAGGLGDIGCHTIDSAYWALNLGAPTSVEVEMMEKVNPIFTPNGAIVTYNFPSRNNKAPVKIKWYEGPSKPVVPKEFDVGEFGDAEGGFMMIGDKGGIHYSGMRPDSPKMYPIAKWEEYRANPKMHVAKTLERTPALHQDFINAIKNGKKACSDFSYSAPLTEAIILGTLAIRTGQTVNWNSEIMEITGNPEASRMVNVEARAGWRLEDLA